MLGEHDMCFLPIPRYASDVTATKTKEKNEEIGESCAYNQLKKDSNHAEPLNHQMRRNAGVGQKMG